MKTEISSFTMNSSASFTVAAKNEIALGWNSMPSFPVEAVEIELGWDAMPAYGAVTPDQGKAELAADFVMEARSIRPLESADMLLSFWSSFYR